MMMTLVYYVYVTYMSVNMSIYKKKRQVHYHTYRRFLTVHTSDSQGQNKNRNQQPNKCLVL